MEMLKLTNETVDMLSEKLAEMYAQSGANQKDTLRARLIMEEALLKYQSRFGDEVELYFRSYKIFSQTRFVIRLRCASFDPFTLEENPMGFMIQSILSSFEDSMPAWKYRNLENELVFTVHRREKLSGVARIGIAVAAALAISFPLRFLAPTDVLTTIVNDYVDPLTNAYAGLFCIMAVLCTFFAIVLGIVHLSDVSTASAFGRKLLARFYMMTGIIVIAITLPVLPFFEIGDGGSIALATKSVYDILIGFFPSNLVSPFLDFNSVHIMIVGAMFGFSLLAMSSKGETTVKLFDECNLVTILTNNFLNKFIYYYIALKIFVLVTTSDFSELGGAGRIIALIVVGELIILVFYTLYVCLKHKISIIRFINTAVKPFIICLSSANFSAAFQSVTDALEDLDAMDDASNVGTNLGGVVFRPACTLVFILSSISMASFYNVPISPVWIVTAIILSLLLVAAVPNVPGASVSVITLLYMQLGLPSSAVGLMIAINAPLQFLTVAVDTWCLTAECVNISYVTKKQGSKKPKTAP